MDTETCARGCAKVSLVRPRLGIYVQVPFCQTKCTYCNFHTGVVSSARFAPYVSAVCTEIEKHRDFYANTGVELPSSFRDAVADTVYFGGGTPSLLDPVHLQRMLGAIREKFVSASPEVTLEADPETVEAVKAASWVRAGINRVSFGVQSFSDAELKATGRMHRRADVYRAVPILRDAGIRNLSFDLISGLPGQTRESWRASLDELDHLIACFGTGDRTQLGDGHIQLPDHGLLLTHARGLLARDPSHSSNWRAIQRRLCRSDRQRKSSG